MPVKKLPYKSLEPLIRRYLSKQEDPGTVETIRALSGARGRGYLTKQELELVCRWKSPRAIRHIRCNREKKVQSITRSALATRGERKKLDLLLSLSGVSVPMASSLLMLTNPRRYGVIDIRVWQLLHKMGAVDSTPSGIGFGFKQWYRFLTVIRHFARKLGVSARDIERTLFEIHVRYQKGKLYPR